MTPLVSTMPKYSEALPMVSFLPEVNLCPKVNLPEVVSSTLSLMTFEPYKAHIHLMGLAKRNFSSPHFIVLGKYMEESSFWNISGRIF